MLQAELKILAGKHQGKLIPLNTKKFLVGREQDCHLRPNSDLVSRHHCVFSIDDYAIRLRDLGSTNGTMLNGVNLRGEAILKSGDRVSIGKLDLEVVIRKASAKATPSTPQPVVSSKPPTAPVAMTAAEISIPSEEAETSYELETFPTPVPVAAPGPAPADTAIISGAPQFPPQMQPPGYPPQGYPQMMPPGYPMPGYGQPQYPPQYPPQYAPGYGQPGGYGMPMGYPMGYPQPMQPMMPMQPGYPGGVAVQAAPVEAAPAVEEPEAESSIPAIRLPNPEETGAKAPAAPTAAAGGAKKEEKPSTSAADIIKQYMNRRK